MSVAGQHDACESLPRLDLVKRNIASEIDSICDTARRPVLDSLSADAGVLPGNDRGKEIGLKHCLDSELSSSSAAVVTEKGSSESALACETASKDNLELENFATNFLSLYCR